MFKSDKLHQYLETQWHCSCIKACLIKNLCVKKSIEFLKAFLIQNIFLFEIEKNTFFQKGWYNRNPTLAYIIDVIHYNF